MLISHLAAVEKSLLAISQIPANSGHNLHKGTPREAFIKEFLQQHLSERIAIGTGEIIDCNSKPNERRNQIDIILYKRDYPKLSFGGGINGFFAESVVATIEVKSILDAQALNQSIQAARNIKALNRHITTTIMTGHQPPSILNYVVAYDGPATMKTVYPWLKEEHQKLGIVSPPLPKDLKARVKIPSPTLDGVFVLGKGFMQFDNTPLTFIKDNSRESDSNLHWSIGDTVSGSLLVLFVNLTVAVSGMSASWLNAMPYIEKFSVQSHCAGA